MKQALDLLNAKIALELEITKPILRSGLNYIGTWESGRGHIPSHDRSAYQSQLESLLIRHYARVVMVMQGRRPPKNPTLNEACHSLLHMESLFALAKKNAGLILRSLDRELAQGIAGTPEIPDDGLGHSAKSFDTKADADTITSPATVSYWAKIKATVAKVTAKFKSKIGTIANVNTNPIAENARAYEVQIVAPKDANSRLYKEWTSLMDGRERPTHHDAHEQRQPADGTFAVGDSLLRFPGDTSLGASLGEICNCRCFLTWIAVNNETGEETIIHQGVSAPTRRFRKPGDKLPPVMRPTSVVSLNGRTTARVIMGDGKTIGTLRQPSESTIEVLVNRRVVARATIQSGRAVNVTVDKTVPKEYDIEGLIRRSVESSATMDRRPHSERVP